MRAMADPRPPRALQVTARALGKAGRQCARVGDVTPQQAETLQLIVERGSVSTSSLAALLAIDPSTASRNLAGLEREGLIVRRRGTNDGRQTDVRLTPRGRRIADAVSTQWAAVTAALLDRTPRAERARILDALDTLCRLLDEKSE
jgi:DNA-binding MarR family transcriptional regulator